MENRGVTDRKGLRRVTISIVLTALFVILLVLLLTLTVHHTREGELARQFGEQQVALARGIAARLDDLFLALEKSLRLLSLRRVSSRPDALVASIYEHWEGKIAFLALMNEVGGRVQTYPSGSVPVGLDEGALPLVQEARRTGRTAAGLVPLKDGEGERVAFLLVAIPGSPLQAMGGVWLAALPESVLRERYLQHLGSDSHLWLTDGEGKILVAVEALRNDGSDAEGPVNLRSSNLKRAMLTGREGYGEYRLETRKGRIVRHLIAHAPVQRFTEPWSVAVATPYSRVIGLVRKDFVSTLAGAAFLILAVVFAAAALLYAGRKRLHFRAAQASLKEREAWEEKLLREKRTAEGIIEGSPIPTFVLGRDHRIIRWNAACADLTGHAAVDMIGTENQYVPFYSERRPVIADLILERDFESLVKYYGTKRVRKSTIVEGAYEARDFYRNLGGRDRHLYFLAAPIYGENGEILAAIETLQDISREEEMAQELREYTETLQNELQENIRLRQEVEALYSYLHSIVESLPDRIFVLSHDGRIQYVSKDVRQGVGLFPRPTEGRHFLEIVAPEIREQVKGRWEAAQQGIHTPFEIEVRARDGSPRNLLITSVPLRGTDRYLVVQRDITEFKTLKERFYESEKLAAVGQLSAGIAHEVRNPLSSIKMSLQILEKRMHPEGNDLRRFRIAEREVEHLEQLVNDVLIFAKPSKPQPAPHDLCRILEQALALAEKALEDKEIAVRTRFPERLPLLMVDAAMLEQAFLNLILNAVEAMEQKGSLEISVSALDPGEGAALEVVIRDNGCGIEEQDKVHLFNPFFTRKKYGTGLGLTQVKKIVELHQGAVQIFSRWGEGTQVIILLPRQQDERRAAVRVPGTQ